MIIHRKGWFNVADLDFNIVETCKVLSVNENTGWRKELNLISWNQKPVKYDIRDWSPDRTRMGKGITLTEEELQNLLDFKSVK